jgi:hypothetical protein
MDDFIEEIVAETYENLDMLDRAMVELAPACSDDCGGLNTVLADFD